MAKGNADNLPGSSLDTKLDHFSEWMSKHLRHLVALLWIASFVLFVLWLWTTFFWPAQDSERVRTPVSLADGTALVVDHPKRFLADDQARPVFLTVGTEEPISVTLEMSNNLPLILTSVVPSASVRTADAANGYMIVSWPLTTTASVSTGLSAIASAISLPSVLAPSVTTDVTTTVKSTLSLTATGTVSPILGLLPGYSPSASPTLSSTLTITTASAATAMTGVGTIIPGIGQDSTIALYFKNASSERSRFFLPSFSDASFVVVGASDGGRLGVQIETTDRANWRLFAEKYTFLAVLPFLTGAMGYLIKAYIDRQSRQLATAKEGLEEFKEAMTFMIQQKNDRYRSLERYGKYLPTDDWERAQKIFKLSIGRVPVNGIDVEEFSIWTDSWAGALVAARDAITARSRSPEQASVDMPTSGASSAEVESSSSKTENGLQDADSGSHVAQDMEPDARDSETKEPEQASVDMPTSGASSAEVESSSSKTENGLQDADSGSHVAQDTEPDARDSETKEMEEQDLYDAVRVFPVDQLSPQAEQRFRGFAANLKLSTLQHNWPLPAESPDNYSKYPTKEEKDNKTPLTIARMDLFPVNSAQDPMEHRYLFSDSAKWFWRKHPLYQEITTNDGPFVVIGEPGSGRTALALSLTRYADRNNKQVLGSFHSGTVMPTQVQFGLAHELLRFVQQRSTWLTELERHDRDLLAGLLLTPFDSRYLLARLKKPEGQVLLQQETIQRQALLELRLLRQSVERVAKEPVIPKTQWYLSLTHCVHLLGFEKVRVALDMSLQGWANLRKNRIVDLLQVSQENHAVPIQFVFMVADQDNQIDPDVPGITRRELLWLRGDGEGNSTADRLQSMLEQRATQRGIDKRLLDSSLPARSELCRAARGNPRRLADLWQQIQIKNPAGRKLDSELVEAASKETLP